MSYLDHFSAERANQIYTKVLKLLQTKRLYRRPDITARQIAEMADEDYRAVSAALAITTGEKFNVVVARLRVREACRLLRDPKFADYTLEAIGLRAGFSSRQSFYNAFRSIMGSTPNDYRKGNDGSCDSSGK